MHAGRACFQASHGAQGSRCVVSSSRATGDGVIYGHGRAGEIPVFSLRTYSPARRKTSQQQSSISSKATIITLLHDKISKQHLPRAAHTDGSLRIHLFLLIRAFRAGNCLSLKERELPAHNHNITMHDRSTSVRQNLPQAGPPLSLSLPSKLLLGPPSKLQLLAASAPIPSFANQDSLLWLRVRDWERVHSRRRQALVRDVPDAPREQAPQTPHANEPLPRVPPADVYAAHQHRARARAGIAAAVPADRRTFVFQVSGHMNREVAG